VGQLRRSPKGAESSGNGARDDTVAYLVAGELIGNGLAEAVTVGQGQRQGGVIHGKRLIVGKADRHERASRCAVENSARWWSRLL
jgi:hypothetical protein